MCSSNRSSLCPLPAPACERLRDSCLIEVVLTDTVPLPPSKRIPKIKTIGIAGLIGEAIKRIHRGESVGALFSSEVSLTQELLLWEDGYPRTLDTRGAAQTCPPLGSVVRADSRTGAATRTA